MQKELSIKTEIKIGNRMAGFTLIADLVAAGQEFGVFDFYLPWIITFSIFWALLTKVKLFGNPYDADKTKRRMARGVNLIIALGASLYIMANTTAGVSFATFLSGLFGGTFMVILTIIAFVTVLYVMYTVTMGKDPLNGEEAEKNWKWIAAFAVLAAIIFALSVYTSTSGAALFPGFVLPGFEVPSLPTLVLPSINLTSQDLAIFFLFAVTAVIVFYVAWGGGEKEDAGKKKKVG